MGLGNVGRLSAAALMGSHTASAVSGATVQSSNAEAFFQLWDGTSGANRDQWNMQLAAYWKRTLGDWTDAKGIASGTTPYASAQIAAGDGTGTVEFDVKSLVQQWLTDGNRGALLRTRGGGVAIYASREYPDPALRPSLTVTTDKGTYNCECRADSWLDASTVRPLGTQPSFRVATSVIQFDLSSVAGAMVSATMRLHAVRQSASGYTDVYLLDPPLVLDKPASKAELGFAAKYPKDAGIETYRTSKKTGIAADSSVFMCADFSDGWEKAWDVSRAIIVDRPSDVELGHKVARCRMTPTQHTSLNLSWFFEKHGQPDAEEMYVRSYVLFESDWFSTKEACKAYVAADGRYGWLSPANNEWQPVYGGNGGQRTSGCFHPAGVAVKGFPVYDKAKDIYSGWSTRLHTMAKKAADGNPYPDYVPIGAYVYDADMRGNSRTPFSGYGSLPRMGSQSAGWPVCKFNHWYCIELRVKLNSLDTSTANAYENCDGFSNGIEEVWVDGVKYYSRTNKRFRRHPKIKIQGPWINWFHGGTLFPSGTHHHRMGNIVVASRYIGPMG